MTRLLEALSCQNSGRPPVWLMRQAGRYLPEYRALRQTFSLWDMFHRPEVAAAVTRLPVDLLQVDAAILFSDILVIAEVFGLRTLFPESGGPRIEPSLCTPEDVERLEAGDVKQKLSFVFDTIDAIQLPVPLIGFCGGPFTVASYMIGGGKTRAFFERFPHAFHQLLDKLTAVSIAYLKEQVIHGVQAVQIFDSWANLLDDAEFAQFSLRYLQKMVDALRGQAPVILFCRGSSLRSHLLSPLCPSAISFDWHNEMHWLRAHVPPQIAVQGNLDPEILRQSPEEIIAHTKRLLTRMHGEKGFIANLGHGVLPDIPVSHVRAFVDTVRTFL